MAKAPDMSRNKELAGQTVSKGGYNITYDSNGYATKATNYKHDHFAGTEKSKAAKSADTVTSKADRSSYGGSAYDQQYFSDAELQNAAEMRAAAEASGDWSRAHEYVERLRAKYGYSGGADGSEFNPLDLLAWDPDGGSSSGGGGYSSGGISGGFSYGNAPVYVNRYQDQIDELTKAILNREAFSYDPETDPTYQQYKESYTRSGERAMQDTLGQVSARTGGLASSYAGSAAQQTYDNYMAALSDKIPELRQLAYSMYMDEGDTQRANLEMLMALEQGDYAKYADLLAQFNTDRSFNYGVYRDNIADSRYDQEWNYQVGRDQIADNRYEDETAWERSNYTSEKEYNQALTKAQTLAAAGDFSGYKALGYTDAEIAGLKSAYDKAQAAALLSSRSSGSSSGSKTSSGAQDYDGLFQAAQASGHAKSFIANNYKKYGFSSSSGLYDDYEAWEKNGGGNGGGDDDYTVVNRHGYGSDGLLDWIHIPGHGRFSVQEVYNYVESGQIKETIGDDGTIRYTWVNNK